MITFNLVTMDKSTHSHTINSFWLPQAIPRNRGGSRVLMASIDLSTFLWYAFLWQCRVLKASHTKRLESFELWSWYSISNEYVLKAKLGFQIYENDSCNPANLHRPYPERWQRKSSSPLHGTRYSERGKKAKTTMLKDPISEFNESTLGDIARLAQDRND